jgi:osmotically-inducible protein OsmY
MHKADSLLEKDVKEQLDWDTVIDSTRIIVKASEGHVTLTGAVPTYYDWLEASDDAWRVSGVKSLDNELTVGLAGEAIEDADVAAACRAALDGDRLVPQGAVTVAVLDGWVRLGGTVRHHFQRKAANQAVSKVAGVRGVEDNIRITADPIPSDVTDRINRALQRDAIIDHSLIKVSNSGHIVYLDGTVGSFVAMEEAVDTAWNAPGVTDVVNRLTIVT